MSSTGGGDRKGDPGLLLPFSIYLLASMAILILIMAAGITYFDLRQAEESYYQNAHAMQVQTEADLVSAIRVIDDGYEIYDSSLNARMEDAFRLFLRDYREAGGDPGKMDLYRLKEELGGTMDLYVINDSIVVEYTTYAPDLGLDFAKWPYSYTYLADILTREGFFPDRVVYEATSGELRKYAYMPTPDHHYILELGLTEEGMGGRPAIEYRKNLRAIAFNNPAITSFRTFDTVGREIGYGSQPGSEPPAPVKQVIATHQSIEVEDPGNLTVTRYLFVDLSDSRYAADTSWIIELVYDQSGLQDELSSLLRFHAMVALAAIALCAGIGLVLSQHLTVPVTRMVDDIDTISRGDLDHPIVPPRAREFRRIEVSVTALVGTLKGMIERLKEREHELEVSEEKYRTVVENQTELIARFLPDGTLVFSNEAYGRYFGLPPTDNPGAGGPSEVFGAQVQLLARHLTSLTPDNPSTIIEHRVIGPGNDTRWLQWHAHAIPGSGGSIAEYLAVGRDITEKRQVEEELIESERRFRDLASLLPQVIFEIDPGGRITYVNHSAYHMFGYSPTELGQGISFSEVIHPDSREEAARNFATILQGMGRSGGSEYRLVRKDGSVLTGMVYSSPIIREGRVYGIRGILVDISQLKQVENDLRDLNEELEHRVAERTRALEEANRELEAFSYSVSHDLRAPLRAIDGFSSIVMNEHGAAIDPGMKALLERIRGNARKMGELIDAILNFSRMSRQPLSREQVFPARIVQEVLEELEPLRGERAIDIRIGDLPPCNGDPALVKQVFSNLIGNALKFTRTRQEAVISIGSYREGGGTVYTVSDNGVGFDMRYAGKLFSVFQRLHDEKEYEGTGIGLAIVHRIIQRHGGQVWARAGVDQGASFFFTLE